MNKFSKFFLCLGLLALVSCGEKVKRTTPSWDEGINLIPQPKEMVQGEGVFALDAKTKVFAPSDEVKPIVDYFLAKVARSTGYKFSEASSAGSGVISFTIDPSLELKDEGYKLSVTPEEVKVTGKTPQALFYGMQSLLQLLPAEIESDKEVNNVLWNIPQVEITDEPAFGYRGMHIDVSRHFIGVDDIKKQLDLMAMFKINRFHWHLTDDQGWRIEIKKYPKLIEVGSKRIEDDGTEYGGYYTQEQIKDVVAYAKERFITVVPEIEMPGHSIAAIAAYPDLACFPQDFKVRFEWGISKDILCAGKDHTYQFLSDVIAEVAPLFPGEYFHVGGDEAPKGRWNKCPLCQAKIKKEGLKDAHELQSYVIRWAEKELEKYGKKLIGWDEILEGGLAPSATVMSWRGEEGGIEASNMGHDVIMTPGSGGLYIDHYQGDPMAEPYVALCCYSPLERTYSYYPIPDKIDEDKRHHILGAQVNLWGEYFYTPEIFEYRAWPRVMALAELTWTPREKKDFQDFSRRVNNAYVRLDGHGQNYHIPIPEQPNGSCDFIAFTDSTILELKTTRPIKMVFTTDGSEPTKDSPEWTKSLVVKDNLVVKAASVLPHGKLSPVRTITFEKQSYAPAVEEASLKLPLKEGLQTRTLVGDFTSAADLEGKTTGWVDGVAKEFSAIIPDRFDDKLSDITRKSVEATGYLSVGEDGVYQFSTDYDQFWIDGKLLIDNTGKVKKFSRQTTTIALAKGLHPIKVIFIGASTGGFPSYWDGGQVRWRQWGEPELTAIKGDKLFY